MLLAGSVALSLSSVWRSAVGRVVLGSPLGPLALKAYMNAVGSSLFSLDEAASLAFFLTQLGVSL